MFKGWRGFFFVGTFMVPLIVTGWASYFYFKHHEPHAGMMGIVACIWIISSFLNTITANTWQSIANGWQDVSSVYKIIVDDCVGFIKSRKIEDDFTAYAKEKLEKSEPK